jgi:hypothetical protein
MNDEHDDREARALDVPRAGPPRLRLVRSDRLSIAPRAHATRVASTFACPQRLRLVGRRTAAGSEEEDDHQRRRFDRQEGRTMESMERFIYSMSRFVFGLGIGLALTSAWVIVTTGGDLLLGRPVAAEVVRLDPVEVTISAERYDAIRADADVVRRAVHVYGGGPQQV